MANVKLDKKKKKGRLNYMPDKKSTLYKDTNRLKIKEELEEETMKTLIKRKLDSLY